MNMINPDAKDKNAIALLQYIAEERKARKEDIRYMNEFFPDTAFGRYPNLGHAGFVLLKPELFTYQDN